MCIRDSGIGDTFCLYLTGAAVGSVFQVLQRGVKVNVVQLRKMCIRDSCLRVIRFRQSGQYLTLFDFDAKDAPHTVHFRISSVW